MDSFVAPQMGSEPPEFDARSALAVANDIGCKMQFAKDLRDANRIEVDRGDLSTCGEKLVEPVGSAPVCTNPATELPLEQSVERQRESRGCFVGEMIVDLRSAATKKRVHRCRFADGQHRVPWKAGQCRNDHALIEAIDIRLKHAGKLRGLVHSISPTRTRGSRSSSIMRI